MAGVGAFSAGLILSFAAWPDEATPGQVAQVTLDNVGIYTVIASTCLWLIGLLFISKVKEDRATHTERLSGLTRSAQDNS